MAKTKRIPVSISGRSGQGGPMSVYLSIMWSGAQISPPRSFPNSVQRNCISPLKTSSPLAGLAPGEV